MLKILVRIFLSVLMLATISIPIRAQAGGSTSEIKGRITDPNGATVSGVTVTAPMPKKALREPPRPTLTANIASCHCSPELMI